MPHSEFALRCIGGTTNCLLVFQPPGPFDVYLVVDRPHAGCRPGNTLSFVVFRMVAHLSSKRNVVAGCLHMDLFGVQESTAFERCFNRKIGTLRRQAACLHCPVVTCVLARH